MKKRTLLVGSLIALILLFFSTQAVAEIIWDQGSIATADDLMQSGEEGKISLGNLQIIPSLRLGGAYDSNIYLSNSYMSDPNNPGTVDPASGKLRRPEESDYIFHIMPGLLLNYKMPERGNLKLGYEGDWAFYKEFTSQNWNNQTGFMDFNYKAPSGLLVGVKNVYRIGDDPYGDAVQSGLGYTQDRWTNRTNVKTGWEFSDRFRVIGYYDWYKQEYKDDRNFTQNWSNNVGGLGFEMKVMQKTWAFVRYHYGTQNFDDGPTTVQGVANPVNTNNDASNNRSRVSMGLAWDGFSKLGGELNFGYQWLRYDNDFNAAGDQFQDRNTWVAATAIDYEATSTTRLTLILNRAVRPTGAATTENYDDTQAGIRVFQDLPYKFSARASFIYSRNDYNTWASFTTSDRTDNNYNANINFKYLIRPWLNTSLGYRFMKKDSNDVTQPFDDHQVMLTVGANY